MDIRLLGRICPKPCERRCRRAAVDDAVSIYLLKRYVADVDLESSKPYSPACRPKWDKRVAVVGAGPAKPFNTRIGKIKDDEKGHFRLRQR